MCGWRCRLVGVVDLLVGCVVGVVGWLGVWLELLAGWLGVWSLLWVVICVYYVIHDFLGLGGCSWLVVYG